MAYVSRKLREFGRIAEAPVRIFAVEVHEVSGT